MSIKIPKRTAGNEWRARAEAAEALVEARTKTLEAAEAEVVRLTERVTKLERAVEINIQLADDRSAWKAGYDNLTAEVARLTIERDEQATDAYTDALRDAEARAARAETLVEAGLGLIRAEADKYDHPNQWVARDLLHSVANRVAALGGAK